MKRITFVALLVLFSIPAFAQLVTPIQPPVYDGACEIQNVDGRNLSGWAMASMDFTCHGTFYGNMTDSISVEAASGVIYGGTYTSGIYASSSDSWPKLGYYCTQWGCFQTIVQPIPTQWHTSVAVYNPPSWVGHGNVRWDTGAAVCYWWYCWAPTNSVDAYSGGTIGINDPTPPRYAY